MIKGSIPEENITFLNIYEPNTEVPKYIKQILTDIKGEIDNNTIIVGDFNPPLICPSMDKSSRQKINKARVVLSDPVDQLDLTDTYRTLHPKPAGAHSFQVHMNVLHERSPARPQNKSQQI